MIKYRWRWICDICGEETEQDQEYTYRYGEIVAKASSVPGPPWRQLDDRHICGRHKVTIEDA